ncbi:MAG: sensor histidine kinase [Rhodobacteraceae bacterium]|nr:sensor histidine kinase [Paracoccaceae bacterium]
MVFLTISVASFERGQLESLANQISLFKNIYLEELDSCEEPVAYVNTSQDSYYNIIGPLESSPNFIPTERPISRNEAADEFLYTMGYSSLGFRYEQYENGEINCRQKYDFNIDASNLEDKEILMVDLREENIFASLKSGFVSLYNKIFNKDFVYTVFFDREIENNREVYEFKIQSEKVLISFEALFRVILIPSILILIVNTVLITLGSVMFFSRPIDRIARKIQGIHSMLYESGKKEKQKTNKKSIFLEINRIEREIALATDRLRPINTLEGEGAAFRHEIQNYLSTINSSIHNMVTSLEEKGKPYHEKIKSIETIGQMISAKVEHLVNYVTTDPRNLPKEEVSLGKLLTLIKQMGDEVAKHHGVDGPKEQGEGDDGNSIFDINWINNKQQEVKVNANWESLYGVIHNLILNAIVAIKYRMQYEKEIGIENVEYGKILITVKESGDGQFINIFVKDNGTGVEATIRQTLFDYGVQGTSNISKNTGSSPLGGVGLHYAFQQINYQGGELKLDWTSHFLDKPTPRKTGTRFKITLPKWPSQKI